MKLSHVALALTCLAFGASAALAQDLLPAASRGEAFPNTTGKGTAELKATLWYPTQGPKTNDLAPGPHPVIVFLHGRGGFAMAYAALGERLAERGYVVVLSDTARVNPTAQMRDGSALFHALRAANEAEASFWKGALDMSAAGVTGHSMGGGASAHILAENPGYKAGFCFAPWQGAKRFSDAVAIQVPVGIIHGVNDRTLPWKSTGKALYDQLPTDCSGRFLYVLKKEATHLNIALSFPFSSEADKAVFKTCVDLCLAFFDAHLRNSPAGLEALLTAENPLKLELYRGETQAKPTTPTAPKRPPPGRR